MQCCWLSLRNGRQLLVRSQVFECKACHLSSGSCISGGSWWGCPCVESGLGSLRDSDMDSTKSVTETSKLLLLVSSELVATGVDALIHAMEPGPMVTILCDSVQSNVGCHGSEQLDADQREAVSFGPGSGCWWKRQPRSVLLQPSVGALRALLLRQVPLWPRLLHPQRPQHDVSFGGPPWQNELPCCSSVDGKSAGPFAGVETSGSLWYGSRTGSLSCDTSTHSHSVEVNRVTGTRSASTGEVDRIVPEAPSRSVPTVLESLVEWVSDPYVVSNVNPSRFVRGAMSYIVRLLGFPVNVLSFDGDSFQNLEGPTRLKNAQLAAGAVVPKREQGRRLRGEITVKSVHEEAAWRSTLTSGFYTPQRHGVEASKNRNGKTTAATSNLPYQAAIGSITQDEDCLPKCVHLGNICLARIGAVLPADTHDGVHFSDEQRNSVIKCGKNKDGTARQPTGLHSCYRRSPRTRRRILYFETSGTAVDLSIGTVETVAAPGPLSSLSRVAGPARSNVECSCCRRCVDERQSLSLSYDLSDFLQREALLRCILNYSVYIGSVVLPLLLSPEHGLDLITMNDDSDAKKCGRPSRSVPCNSALYPRPAQRIGNRSTRKSPVVLVAAASKGSCWRRGGIGPCDVPGLQRSRVPVASPVAGSRDVKHKGMGATSSEASTTAGSSDAGSSDASSSDGRSPSTGPRCPATSSTRELRHSSLTTRTACLTPRTNPMASRVGTQGSLRVPGGYTREVDCSRNAIVKIEKNMVARGATSTVFICRDQLVVKVTARLYSGGNGTARFISTNPPYTNCGAPLEARLQSVRSPGINFACIKVAYQAVQDSCVENWQPPFPTRNVLDVETGRSSAPPSSSLLNCSVLTGTPESISVQMEWLNSPGYPIDGAEFFRAANAVFSTLEVLHNRNVVHRDIRWSNVRCFRVRRLAPLEASALPAKPHPAAKFALIDFESAQWAGAGGEELLPYRIFWSKHGLKVPKYFAVHDVFEAASMLLGMCYVLGPGMAARVEAVLLRELQLLFRVLRAIEVGYGNRGCGGSTSDTVYGLPSRQAGVDLGLIERLASCRLPQAAAAASSLSVEGSGAKRAARSTPALATVAASEGAPSHYHCADQGIHIPPVDQPPWSGVESQLNEIARHTSSRLRSAFHVLAQGQ